MADKTSVRININAIDGVSSKLGKIGASFRRFGARMQSVGRSLSLNVTAPVAFFGVSTLKAAGDFEIAMNNVQALARGATGQALNDLKDTAKELGRTTKFTAGQAGDAMVELGRAGFDAKEILDTVKPTLDLATSSMEGTDTAGKILAKTLRGFKLPTKESARVADVLANAFSKTNVTLVDFFEASKLVAPVAAANKQPLEEISAIIGALGNAGIDASIAGTSLRRALINLAAPTAAAKNALGQLGITRKDIQRTDGSVKSLVGILGLLRKKAPTPAQLNAIFGARALASIQALLGTGPGQLEKLTKEMGETGRNTKLADIQMQGLVGKLRELISAFEGFQIALAESGALEFFTNLAKRTATWFRQLAKTNPETLRLVTIIAGFAAALGPLLIALGFTISSFGSIIGLVGALGKAFGFLSIVILSNPIGLLLLGLAAVAFVVMRNWSAVRGFFEDTWDKILTAFSVIKSIIKLMLIPLLMIANQLKGPWISLKDIVASAWSGITSSISGAWKLIEPIFEKLQSGISKLKSVGSAISGFFGSVGSSIKSNLGEFKSAINTTFSAEVAQLQGKKQSSSEGGLPGLAETLFNVLNRANNKISVDFGNVPAGTVIKTSGKGLDVNVNTGINSLGG